MMSKYCETLDKNALQEYRELARIFQACQLAWLEANRKNVGMLDVDELADVLGYSSSRTANIFNRVIEIIKLHDGSLEQSWESEAFRLMSLGTSLEWRDNLEPGRKLSYISPNTTTSPDMSFVVIVQMESDIRDTEETSLHNCVDLEFQLIAIIDVSNRNNPKEVKGNLVTKKNKKTLTKEHIVDRIGDLNLGLIKEGTSEAALFTEYQMIKFANELNEMEAEVVWFSTGPKTQEMWLSLPNLKFRTHFRSTTSIFSDIPECLRSVENIVLNYKTHCDMLNRPMVLINLRLSKEEVCITDIQPSLDERVSYEAVPCLNGVMMQISIITKDECIPYKTSIMPLKGDQLFWMNIALLGNLTYCQTSEIGDPPEHALRNDVIGYLRITEVLSSIEKIQDDRKLERFILREARWGKDGCEVCLPTCYPACNFLSNKLSKIEGSANTKSNFELTFMDVALVIKDMEIKRPLRKESYYEWIRRNETGEAYVPAFFWIGHIETSLFPAPVKVKEYHILTNKICWNGKF